MSQSHDPEVDLEQATILEAWTQRPADDDLPGRIGRMEVLLDLLRDYRVREGIRLTDSVERLGFNATALSEALQQVDRNQQTLTKLGKELDATKRVVVPREEHVRREAERRVEQQMYRRRAMHRMYSSAVLVVAIVAGLTVAGLAYLDQTREHAYDVCVANNKANAATSDYLRAVAATSTNDNLREVAEHALIGFQSSDCGALQ